MSVWNNYSKLTTTEIRTLVAVSAQMLLQYGEGSELSQELLQQSARTNAQEIEHMLSDLDSSITWKEVQSVFENDEDAHQACLSVLDQIRQHPVLARRIEEEYEARKQKMTGVEVVLLAGALVVLAMRIKEVRIGQNVIKFYPANDAVKTFVAGLVKTTGASG